MIFPTPSVDRYRVSIQSKIPTNCLFQSQTIEYIKKNFTHTLNLLIYLFTFNKNLYLYSVAYFFGYIFYTNQSILHVQYSQIIKGSYVKTSNLLVDKNTSIFRHFSIGHNTLIRYIPWDGINFEDRIIITEMWIINETLISIHYEVWQTGICKVLLPPSNIHLPKIKFNWLGILKQ